MNPDQHNQQGPQEVTAPSAPIAEPSQHAVRYIAVDANGNPLPNQPAIVPAATIPSESDDPQKVYMSRPLEPSAPEISEEVRQRHEDSKAKFPMLNLSSGEYVVSAVKRHPIGLLSIWFVVGIVVLVLLGALVAFSAYREAALASTMTGTLPSAGVIAIPIVILIVLTLLGGYIATIVYNGNRFYLTNESVIQEVQLSLFARQEQTVSLSNIEDASYSQDGIIQSLIGYGSIRLSTEGDETTYRFRYVSNPKKQIALLNNAVEAFKNGRPFTND